MIRIMQLTYLIRLKAGNISSTQICREIAIMANRIPTMVMTETGELVSISGSQLNRP